MNNTGFKLDNCDSTENFLFLNEILQNVSLNQPIEIGLECYENPRHFNPNSDFINFFADVTKYYSNKIVHLTLTAKILNINAFSEEDWKLIWIDQLDIVNKINPKYLIVHATSNESKTFSIENQIDNIINNFIKVENIFKRPLFVENTYEDLDFYEKLFEITPKSMNFTFDIGHMKVHSKRTMNEWIAFLLKLKNEGRKIHFHIHDNNGISDLHNTLTQMNDQSMIDFVFQLKNIFPEFNFILESHFTNFNNVYCDYILFGGQK